jgi:hypothetical protein
VLGRILQHKDHLLGSDFRVSIVVVQIVTSIQIRRSNNAFGTKRSRRYQIGSCQLGNWPLHRAEGQVISILWNPEINILQNHQKRVVEILQLLPRSNVTFICFLCSLHFKAIRAADWNSRQS